MSLCSCIAGACICARLGGVSLRDRVRRIPHRCRVREERWAITQVAVLEVHGYPVGDLVPHILRADCHCEPLFDEAHGVWMHQAWDGREQDSVTRTPN